jgi:hypothetical protein
MAPIPNQYGSINPAAAADADKESTLELLPHGHSASYSRLNSDGSLPDDPNKWTRRHRIVSYLLSAGVCLAAARYWHSRGSSPTAVHHPEVPIIEGRVPMPPALSKLDPRKLSFRSVKREGLASPSEAWGDYLMDSNEEEKEKSGSSKKFVPLPTNEWYLVRHILCSHIDVYRYIALCNVFFSLTHLLPMKTHKHMLS